VEKADNAFLAEKLTRWTVAKHAQLETRIKVGVVNQFELASCKQIG
jgi:hypothetical protein